MKNILVLEDNLKTLYALEKLIVQINEEIVVYTAKNIEEAYKFSFCNEINVFILDIILTSKHPGDISGIQFAKQIRKNEDYLFTPIIFISALMDPELYAYKELHCFGYLEKPFSMEKAIKLIENALKYTSPLEENKTLYFRKEGILFSVSLNCVLYVEAKAHHLIIYMLSEVLSVPYVTIKQFLKEAGKYGFFQCRRNIVVNKRYVKSVDLVNRYICLKNCREQIEMGAKYCKNIVGGIKNV